MHEETLKETADKLMQMKGNVKGEAFRTQAKYIKQREGEEGLEKVLKKMSELGYPLNLDEIKYQKMYSEAYDVFFILVAKELFGWNEEDIFDMGRSAPLSSFIIKLSARYFLSRKSLVKVGPMIWDKHFDFGKLEINLNEEKKHIKTRITNYKVHPVMCSFFAGYFISVFKFCTKDENYSIKETKCIFKGDPHHEYLITWE